MKSFLLNFPYLPRISVSESNYLQGSDQPPESKSYMNQNIIISYLYHCFIKTKNKKDEIETKIEKYILGKCVCVSKER
mgnify:FL=1